MFRGTLALRWNRLASLALAIAAGSTAMGQTNNQCDLPGETPDVIVGSLFQTMRHGSIGGITAFSVGTHSCNIGTCWLDWFQSTNQHPVIGQNMFRLKDGRFEQIGQSWLKHGFFATSNELCESNCMFTNGDHLGVNCSDPYSAFLNGDQSGLGPKFEVNPSTGVHPHPVTDGSNTGNAIYKRLQVRNQDLDPSLNAGALYFVEGQYVAADDTAAGNQHNSVSYRRITVSGSSGVFDIALTGTTQQQLPAIHAWAAEDPTVLESLVDVPGDGRFLLSAKVTDLGGGTWHYEYALQNLNSHRSAASFEVAVPPLASVTGIGFHDVDYHSAEPIGGTDWSHNGGSGGVVSWATEPFLQNPQANALRWGTLYNFRFDSSVPAVAGNATIGLWRPGLPGSVSVPTLVPRLCDENGTCDPGETCSNCPEDCADRACGPGESACTCPQDCGSPPGVESSCANAMDDDCDGPTDCLDSDCCGDAACAGPDVDGDLFVGCLDCDDGDSSAWATPGEVGDVFLSKIGTATATLSWDPPLDPGGSSPLYEILRSRVPDEFTVAAVCLADPNPTSTSVTDSEPPVDGRVFFYLVRATNDCPSGEGPLGEDSEGVPRVGRSCP